MFVAVVSLGVAAPDAARKPVVIATGVTIAGVPVGGKMSEAARTRVEAAFGRPLRLQFRDKRWRISPRYLGASAGIDGAVSRALLAQPGTRVRLQVSSTQPRIRRYVNRLDRLFSYDAVDTQVVGVAAGRPQFTEAKTGLTVEKVGMANALTRALRTTNRRRPIELVVSTVEPKVTPANYGPVVIVFRESKRLALFNGPALVRTFGDRHRERGVPDAARQLLDRDEADEPLVDSTARLGVGEGQETGPSGAGESARDAVDGADRAARRDPRDSRRGIDRLLGLPRLHPDARSGSGVALRAGEPGDAGPDRSGLAQGRVEHADERPWHVGQVQRSDQIGRVSGLPAAAAAHPAPELVLDRLAEPGRLLLESAECLQITVRLCNAFDGCGAVSADQLVLEVSLADEETQSLHVGTGEVRAHAGPLEPAPEVGLLLGVAETGEREVPATRAEAFEEAADRLCAAYRDDGDPFRFEIPTVTLGQGLDRALVADPFHEHGRPGIELHAGKSARGGMGLTDEAEARRSSSAPRPRSSPA